MAHHDGTFRTIFRRLVRWYNLKAGFEWIEYRARSDILSCAKTAMSCSVHRTLLLLLVYCLVERIRSACSPTCSGGTYCSPTDVCETCLAGFFCIGGSVQPISCGVGTYCVAGSSIITYCPIGTYQPDIEQNSCLTVPGGKQPVLFIKSTNNQQTTTL